MPDHLADVGKMVDIGFHMRQFFGLYRAEMKVASLMRQYLCLGVSGSTP